MRMYLENLRKSKNSVTGYVKKIKLIELSIAFTYTNNNYLEDIMTEKTSLTYTPGENIFHIYQRQNTNIPHIKNF